MTNFGAETQAIVISLAVDDPDLADRLATLLSDVPGLRLAASDERADVSLVVPDGGHGRIDLTSP